MASFSRIVRRCSDLVRSAARQSGDRRGFALRVPVVVAWLCCLALTGPVLAQPSCKGQVYLTLDTGSMRDAELIAGILRRHEVRATFFVANEKTVRGDHSLDPGWAGYWRDRVSEGHAFGSHTLDHVYFRGVDEHGRFRVRPQFGHRAGELQTWNADQVCSEIGRADERFRDLTGTALSRWWRAPGGRAPAAVFEVAQACGWSHVHWAPAGFLGDELPSDRFPNDRLLAQSLRDIRAGDILIAHLGIWSRADPYAPMLDPLIAGLKRKGLCFATLHEHPSLGPRQGLGARR